MCVKKIITTAFSRGAVILHKYRFSVWVKLYSVHWCKIIYHSQQAVKNEIQ